MISHINRSWWTIATLLGVALVVAWQVARTNTALREQLATMVVQTQPEKPAATEPAPDLARQEEMRGLRAEIATLTTRLERATAPVAPPPNLPKLRMPPSDPAASSWTNAGTHEPAAAFQTVMWAATSGEFETLAGLIEFDPEARAQADAFFASLPPDTQAEFGSAEMLVAAMMAARLPLGIESGSVVSSIVESDEATLRMRFTGRKAGRHDTYFHLRRDDNQWKLLVPEKIIEGYRYTVTGASANAAPVTLR